MSALEVLNSISEKRSFKSFKTLAQGEYIIRRFTSVETSYGKRTRIDFDDGYSYLPERYNSLRQDQLDELNTTPKIMVYAGKDRENKER